MPAAVVSRRRRVGVRAADVRRDAMRLLRLLGIDAELSVALVGDEEMQVLNARYRKKDRPTDVLSFGNDLAHGGRGSGRAACAPHTDSARRDAPPPLLGDVVISIDTAARQAAERGGAIDEELRFLLAHGILHLLGYDHERSPAEARRMFAKQRRLIAALENGAECRGAGLGSKPRAKG